jgi:hypothetical protein
MSPPVNVYEIDAAFEMAGLKKAKTQMAAMLGIFFFTGAQDVLKDRTVQREKGLRSVCRYHVGAMGFLRRSRCENRCVSMRGGRRLFGR